jgi:hypothetical protein
MGRKNGFAGPRDAGGGCDGGRLLEERKDGRSRHRALQSGQAWLLLLLPRFPEKQRK